MKATISKLGRKMLNDDKASKQLIEATIGLRETIELDGKKYKIKFRKSVGVIGG